MSALFKPGIHSIRFLGEPAWRKQFGGRERRWRLRLLGLLVSCLGLTALRPPPHPVGAAACTVEARRLRQLAALGVPVPRILEQGPSHLILSDMGQTLAGRLRDSEPAEALCWFKRAAQAVADVHRLGSYLGQPQARNITVDARGDIGFLDFEEDPGAIMGLANAQVRDWLLFMAGTAHHLPQDGVELGHCLRPVLDQAAPKVVDGVRKTARRLGFLAVLAHLPDRRTAGLGKAVQALRQATMAMEQR